MEETKKSPSKAKVALIGASCAALVAAGGTLAYLTDTDSVTNQFHAIDAIDIEVVEPGWDGLPDTDDDGVPDEAEETVPNKTITKDPAVVNHAGTEAWLFARVDIPVANVQTVGEDGQIQAAADTELFTFVKNEGWTQIGTPVLNDAKDTMSYWFSWDDKVAVEAQTDAIFDEVTFANLVEGQLLGDKDLEIDIVGYGIQTAGFDTAKEAWAAYVGQNSVDDAPEWV